MHWKFRCTTRPVTSRNSKWEIRPSSPTHLELCLQEIYNAANSVRSAIPHPRIMGVIKECGGKMWMGESESSAHGSGG